MIRINVNHLFPYRIHVEILFNKQGTEHRISRLNDFWNTESLDSPTCLKSEYVTLQYFELRVGFIHAQLSYRVFLTKNAPPVGLEPTTSALGGLRDIQLRYGGFPIERP